MNVFDKINRSGMIAFFKLEVDVLQQSVRRERKNKKPGITWL
jgi:hypothetical protein